MPLFQLCVTGRLHDVGDEYCPACPLDWPRKHLGCGGWGQSEPLALGSIEWARECDACHESEILADMTDAQDTTSTASRLRWKPKWKF
jgi:hypothetical protein